MGDWLKRNLRARRSFVEALAFVVFAVGHGVIKDVGHAYGWWPDNFLSGLVIAGFLGALLGLVLSLTEPPK